jgi:NAD(P)-dependent dehydrogenase (short-subunit alcohol dehydrogenase family)
MMMIKNWQYIFLSGEPPAPWLQSVNDFLHKEPFAMIFYGTFWFLLSFFAPFAGSVVLILTIVRFTLYSIGYSTKIVDTSEQELAVVITGCDSGFGHDLALACHERGFHVFASCLKQESVNNFLESQKERMMPVLVDVCNDKQIHGLADEVIKWIGEASPSKPRFLHALVNNAGIGVGGLVTWLDIEDFKKNMDVNCFGQIRMVKAFLPTLKLQYAHGRYLDARIVNMVSMAGLFPCLGMSSYSASKFAAEGFSSSLRLELRDFGIKVITMNPSFHCTPLVFDMKSQFQQVYQRMPEDVRTKYGQDYLERNVLECLRIPQSLTWRAENVCRDLTKAVELLRPPSRFVTGSDAKFSLLVLRILPDWCIDLLLPRYLHPAAFMEGGSLKEKQI